jgi:hypothetical protein
MEWIDLLFLAKQLAATALLTRWEAGDLLQAALQDGKLETRACLLGGKDQTRKRFRLNPHDELSPVPAEFWKEVNKDWNRDSDSPFGFFPDGDFDSAFLANTVEIRRADALKFIGEASGSAIEVSGIKNRAPNKGGRPTIYDWPALSADIAVYLADTDLVEGRSGLTKRAEAFFASAEKVPDKGDLNRFLKTVEEKYLKLKEHQAARAKKLPSG